MSNMEINQVLAQMRMMAAAAGNKPTEGPAVSGEEFSVMMKQAVEQVSESQSQAKALATAFESGDPGVELPEVMIALQKASISFQAVNQVRNRLLSAYQEVMRMQV
tara:strand:- start:8842 stop:9159 length:318 start_codon:yes stop_codon:yes gene_type:complete